MRLALYQPDIPQNTGTAMRLCACLGVGLDIIEPCGFVLDDRKIKRSGMDYIEELSYKRHISWENYIENTQGRLILMTTKTDNSYLDFEFKADDILIAGRESAGVPEDVHAYCQNKVTIPMYGKTRSLNVVNATSMILGEAIRQTRKQL